MLKVFLFGSMRVTVGERSHVLTGVCARLLGLLALRHSSASASSRTRLAGTLWPEANEDQARHLLSNAVYRLRRLLGPAAQHVQATPESLRLQEVWLDTEAFRRGLASTSVEDWLAAFDLYSGDLLEEEDTDWLPQPRAQLQELYLSALARACGVLESSQDPEAALRVAHRWATADPLEEAAHQALMRLYARQGRPEAALNQYQRLVEMLKTELGAEPRAATRELAETLRRQKPVTKPAAAPPVRRFIGRTHERNLLLQAMEALTSGQGGLVLLEGEAGIGKTQLLHELADAATWRGLQVVWGHTEPTRDQPYAPWPALLAALTTGPRLQQLSNRVTPFVLEVLAPLLPRRASPAARPAPETRTTFPGPTGIAAALQRLLPATAAPPLILLLEDVHWAGSLFWQIAPILASVTAKAPILAVLCYRGLELRQNETVWPLLQRLDRNTTPLRILLEGLSPLECRELAIAQGHPLDPDTTSRYHRLTNGNPLVLEELLQHGGTPSPTLTTLLAAKTDNLEEAEQNALAAASVLGREFAFDAWQSVLGCAPPIPGLLRKRFITETEQAYTFRHDLIRAHLYDALATDQRRRWHGRAAEFLSRQKAPAALLAWHFEEAACWPDAVHHHVRAAEQALGLQAYPAAREHCRRAAALVERFPADEALRLRLRVLRARLDQIEKRTVAGTGEALALEALALELEDHEALLEVLALQIDHLESQNRIEEVKVLAQRLLELARKTGNRPAEIRGLNQLARKLMSITKDSDRGAELASQAVALAEEAPENPALMAASLATWLSCVGHGGRIQNAEALAQRFDALLESHPELASFQTEAQFLRAIRAQFNGRPEEALNAQLRLLEIHKSVGNDAGIINALGNASRNARFIGQIEEATLLGEELLQRLSEQSTDRDVLHVYRGRVELAQCYTLANALDQAEAVLQPVLNWLEAGAQGRLAVETCFALGGIRFYAGRPDEAQAAYRRGLQLSGSDRIAGETLLLSLAETSCLLGRPPEAADYLQRAEAVMQEKSQLLRDDFNSYYHFVRFLCTRQPRFLEQARRCIDNMAVLFQDPKQAQDFRQRVPLHQDIEKHWQALRDSGQVLRLPCADPTTGKPPADPDFIEFLWNPPQEPDFPPASEGKVARRQLRLRQLMSDLQAAGAIASQADLARILGVSLRTIERDCSLLAKNVESLAT